MISLVRGADATVASWVAVQLGLMRGFGPCAAIGVARNEDLIGGVVFSNWAPEAGVMEMTAAATDPLWLNREVIRTVFEYAFKHHNCQLVVWRVSPGNERTVALAERLGFTATRIPRLRGRNEDELLFALTDDRWVSGRYARSDA